MHLLRLCTITATIGGAISINDAVAQPTPSYVVTISDMAAWNGVTRSVDTDYISLWVQGPNGQQFSRTSGPNPVRRGQMINWALSSSPITLPADQHSVLTISWAAVNKENTTSIQEVHVKEALANATAGIAASGATASTVIASSLAAAGVGFGPRNCDAPLFGQSVSFDGATLAAGLNGNGWSPEGTNAWRAIFDYQPIVTNCVSNGHYNLEVQIIRQ